VKIKVVIPLYKQLITQEELVSIQHLDHFLPGYPRVVIKPRTLDGILTNYETINFPDVCFSSIREYSKLLLSPFFYEIFGECDYILIYQTDCLVFSDSLERFCKLGYDYIGASLFVRDSIPLRLSRVGNGGFSLRRVQAFLNVLKSTSIPSWNSVLTSRMADLEQFSLSTRWLKKLKIIREVRRGVQWYTRHYSLNEDLFWSDRARLFDPGFKVAPLDVSLRFAFDAHPRECFERSGHQLPFGAHAWARWDREFWEPYLLQ
jgi:hypothetical protein